MHPRALVHTVSIAIYLKVFAALMLLTILTVAAAEVNLGPLNLPIALGIATIKVALVALFFMHLLYDDRFNAVVFVTGLLFILLLLAFTIIDPMTRWYLNPIDRNINPPQIERIAP